MARARLRFFDEHSEPIERRIATGLHKLGLAMKHNAWQQAAEDGISPTQGQILAALAVEKRLTGSELAQRLGLKLPTISDSVRVLEEKHLVEREPDPRHPRASLLRLTASGKARAARASAWPEFLASAVSTLSASEQEVFLGGITKMIRALQDNGQIPTTRMCVDCVHFRPHAHEGPRPHHCDFVDAPMAATHLRLDCADQQPAPADRRATSWDRFTMPIKETKR